MIVFLSITPEERTFCPDGGANRSGLQPKATETCLWLSADGGGKKKEKDLRFHFGDTWWLVSCFKMCLAYSALPDDMIINI